MQNQTTDTLREELRLAHEKTARMQQLGTAQGFYLAFFRALDDYKTNVECFEAINEEYKTLFGEYRYKSYESFRYSRDYFNKYKLRKG